MSNPSMPVWDSHYRTRYLHSPAWFARRDHWFAEERRRSGRVRCALCLGIGTPRTLELHHLDYRGVTQTPTGWAAHERHQDLTALHTHCHESVHQLIDHDRSLSALVSRRTASIQAIARLRAKIAWFLESADTL